MLVTTDKAIAWIRLQDSEKPFFLYFTEVAVHTPVTPSEQTRGISAVGTFAIRQGPYKWIEGGYYPEMTEKRLRLRPEEFKPQLYHLENDPSETEESSAANVKTMKQLKRLLNQYRDQGFSLND